MATHSQTLRVGGGVGSSLARLSGPVVLSVGTLLLVLAITAMPNRASSEPLASPHGQLWIGTATTAETLATIDPAIAGTFLSGGRSVTLGATTGPPTAMAWASEASFAADLAAGAIPPSVRVVMYDPEGWAATPLSERQDPAVAMASFGALARRNGYVVVITPHPSLVTVPGAACIAEDGEALAAAYLRCDLQGAAARAADIVEVQAQYLENDVPAYRDFVVAAVGQARRANPGVTVLSGLSTNFTDDPRALFAAWHSVAGVVDGHYLNVPHGIRPEVAVGFLRMLAVD